METTNIYILIDPRDNKVRYVGKANNVSQRYQAHLNKARKHQIHKASWIKQLKELNLRPILEVVDIVPIDKWIFWETYWIAQFKAWGFDLINYTSGGDGCTFANQTSFKKGQGGKKVVGFDSDNNKIYEFETATDASNFFKIHPSLIPKCCSNTCREKTVKNFAWFYYTDIENLYLFDLNKQIENRFSKNLKSNSGSFKKGQKSIRAKKIDVENIITNEKNTFESGEYFANLIGVSQPTISWAIKNNKLIKKTYKVKIHEK